MSDDRIDLSALRTPPPLRESDYAAVRARVLSEVRRRERRRWVVPLQIAAALGALIVIAVLLRPEGDGPRVRAGEDTGAPNAAITPNPPDVWSAGVLTGAPEEAPQAPPPPVIAAKPKPRPQSEPMRIHIQTADPDVRIIWIVAPEKEES